MKGIPPKPSSRFGADDRLVVAELNEPVEAGLGALKPGERERF
ncbi:MAG: hypothetical protein U0414_43540 [Polyangiaceae bacterium]